MLVDPLPGVDRDRLLAGLHKASTEITNARSSIGDPYTEYIQAANRAARTLAPLVTAAEVDRLVLTRRYWVLQSIPGNAGTPPVTALLNAEFDERSRVFDEAERALQEQIRRRSRPGVFVVPDTSFYIEHPDKLEDADLAPHLHVLDEPIHLLVPILVVDQLDGLKRSGNAHTRWRARYTLAVLDRHLVNPAEQAVLRPADFTAIDNSTDGMPRGEVTVEILFDSPGHIRLAIDDDEIIDRAVAAKAFAGRELTIITYDTGQGMRARRAELKCVKLDPGRGPEPPPRGTAAAT